MRIIRIKNYRKQNGIFVRSHKRMLRRMPTRRMHRSGVKEWYTYHDIQTHPELTRSWWFTPPEQYIRVDKTNNWWRFRITKPEQYDRMFIRTTKSKNKKRIVKQKVMGIKKGMKKEDAEIQSIRFPRRYYGISI